MFVNILLAVVLLGLARVHDIKLLLYRPWPSGQGGHTLLPWGRAAWVRSPPAPTQNVPSFRRWRFAMKLSPCIIINIV
jgi:hypothetical protein